MIAVSSSVNRKKDHILTRSASAPETMDAAVATKTIWKNQSDMTECPAPSSSTAANAPSFPLSRSTSSPEGTYMNPGVPMTPPRLSPYIRLYPMKKYARPAIE